MCRRPHTHVWEATHTVPHTCVGGLTHMCWKAMCVFHTHVLAIPLCVCHIHICGRYCVCLVFLSVDPRNTHCSLTFCGRLYRRGSTCASLALSKVFVLMPSYPKPTSASRSLQLPSLPLVLCLCLKLLRAHATPFAPLLAACLKPLSAHIVWVVRCMAPARYMI